MRRNLKFRNYKITKLQNRQSGYVLIALMLMVALAAIAMLTVLPDLKQQIERDREEELQHRGTAYMRAIQHYYKKFNKYPTRIEELQNTNQIRFLRKKYKDPVTGKDFKILHQQDVHLNNGPVLGAPVGAPTPTTGPPPTPVSSPTQQSQGGDDENDSNQGSVPAPTGTPKAPPSKGGDEGESDSDNSQAGGGNAGSASSEGSAGSPAAAPSTGFSGPVFGGGPIMGVVSLSKKPTIREFDKKNHYNDWLFIYDPTSDRGGLLKGPWQTPTTGGLGGNGLGQPVQNMQPGPGSPPQPQPQSPPQSQPGPPQNQENEQ